MWLRDFFSKHFPNCRTMTYGYNASLRSKSVHTILDFSRTFLRALQEVRNSDMVRVVIVHIYYELGFNSMGRNQGGRCSSSAMAMAESCWRTYIAYTVK